MHRNVSSVARGIVAACTALGVVACGSSSPTGGGQHAASITVSPPTASLVAGDSVALTATVKDAQGNTISNPTITWSASDTDAAAISAGGVVSTLLPATDTITANLRFEFDSKTRKLQQVSAQGSHNWTGRVQTSASWNKRLFIPAPGQVNQGVLNHYFNATTNIHTVDNRVGGPMEQGELEEARREAARRGREKIPPGYKDADKDKGDPAGDYLIWRQLMTEATTRKLPVVFITDDIKPDWYRVDQEIRLGARYELREEMMREAGVPLMMMTTRVFIDHAEKYLGDQFSEETKEQAKELPFVVRDDEPSSGGTSVSELLSVFTSWRHWSYGPTRHFMGSLRNELGDSEMEARVTQAVMEGEVSGILSRERGRLILGWMNRELAIGEPVNHDQPVDRDAFEAALAVPPEQDNPDEIWWSRRTIEMSMKRQDATADDLARGSAWLARSREARSIEG